jgi:hypothetical protein
LTSAVVLGQLIVATHLGLEALTRAGVDTSTLNLVLTTSSRTGDPANGGADDD